MSRPYNVVIVGGGPAGTTVARLCAKKGFSTLVLEEDKEIGKPVQCAGLVSKRIKEVNILDDDHVLNEVNGATMFSPDNTFFTVERKETQAYVIDRAAFDNNLAVVAESEGAIVKCSEKVTRIENNSVTTKKNTYPTDYIVIAEGFGCKLTRKSGLSRNKKVLRSTQYRIKTDLDSVDKVKMFFGRKTAPGFFAWIIPENNGVCRVGVAVDKGPSIHYLKNFLKNSFSSYSIIEKGGGCIPILGPINKTVKDNIMVIGDAAGQIKPTTGGGIVINSICANSIIKSITKNNCSIYESLWRNDVAKELKMGKIVRNFSDSLTDREWDRFFKIIKQKNITKTIETYGDMDYPSKLVFHSLADLSLIKFLLLHYGSLPFRK